MLCRLCLLNGECNIHIIYMVYKRDSVSRHVFDRNISQIGDPTTSLQNMFFSELTLPKTNSLPPKNGPKHKKETGLPTIIFQETCSFSWISRSRFFTRLPKNISLHGFRKTFHFKRCFNFNVGRFVCFVCVWKTPWFVFHAIFVLASSIFAVRCAEQSADLQLSSLFLLKWRFFFFAKPQEAAAGWRTATVLLWHS